VTPSVVVRPGRPEEVPAVLGLWRAAGSVPSVSDDPVSLERLLETSAAALLVAEADGRIVGTIIAGWDGWRANFYRLAVLPCARRLSAIVMSEHDPAVALWLAAGYTHDTRVGRYVRTLP
jgi:ribosomal protein S18 acetylase RimI-like enzyme